MRLQKEMVGLMTFSPKQNIQEDIIIHIGHMGGVKKQHQNIKEGEILNYIVMAGIKARGGMGGSTSFSRKPLNSF